MKHVKKGFTLLEILLVVAIIAILAGIVIFAINPNKQLADTRNTQRQADVNTILSAVYQYSVDNSGAMPSGVTTTATEICKTAAASCTDLADISAVTINEKYLTSIPLDPNGSSTDGTGYTIVKSANNRVTVSATHAEGKTIAVTR